MFKVFIIALVSSLILGCTTGHLEYLTTEGEKKIACRTQYDWAPSIDKYAVEYKLAYCAQLAIEQGYRVVDKTLLAVDLTLPLAPYGKQWSVELAQSMHREKRLSDKEYGYLIAYLDLPKPDASTVSNALKSGHYLNWNSDHTEREIRPVFPIKAEDVVNHQTYLVSLKNQKPSKVCFFSYSLPSNQSDFGAHCIKFTYDEQGITRTFINTENESVANNEGVFKERYVLGSDVFAHTKMHLDENNKLIENNLGVAQFYFKRDKQGRRISEVRKNLNGAVVPEHNGFYEARFAFDSNDYALYRKGFDQHGQIMEGPKGYATAYFWFDQNGTFLREEFRDDEDKLVLGPSGSFARIDYQNIDKYGNWRQIKLFDEHEKLITKHAAIVVARYDKWHRRSMISYFDEQMKPAENSRGVSRYQYDYDEKSVVTRTAYSADDRLIE